ncbi:protein kinase domain-containing protein [Actinoplanes sp. HUAS TT8]|uniref:serine/threonine-protein kinase n=1 Tax=Actinoplanes sp. HUAS TT8 TaxID=3447453 RepID=UPI003F51BF75
MSGPATLDGDFGPAHAGLLLGGRYRLLTPIGAGGMAVVWHAHDHVLARAVAIKLVAPAGAGDQRARDRIGHEARAAAALSHPNIAQVYDYGETTTDNQIFPYVVMELVPGGTLLRRISAGPVAPRFALRVCAEIAAALAAAHAEGLVHRDIKPANVMLAPTGAKVVDFGIAAVVSPGGSGEPDSEVLGTAAYVAPERLTGDAVQSASDVYALGVVLYRLLSGHSPWTSEDTRQMLEAHLYVPPAPLSPRPGVPDYVIELCNRCLAKDPTLRPGAPEAAAVLARGAGLRVVSDEPPSPAPSVPGADPTVLIRRPPGARPAIPVSLTSAARGRYRRPLITATLVTVVAGGAFLLVKPLVWADRDDPSVAGAPPASTASSATAPSSARTEATTTPGLATRTRVRSQPATPAGPSVRAGSAGAPAPAATKPAPAQPAPGSAERTLSTVAGTLRATCPGPATAQILSWKAAPPYKVEAVEPGPAAAPTVTFKHGKSLLTMSVSCANGTPVATSQQT